jgi:hypothetical protein
MDDNTSIPVYLAEICSEMDSQRRGDIGAREKAESNVQDLKKEMEGVQQAEQTKGAIKEDLKSKERRMKCDVSRKRWKSYSMVRRRRMR